MSACRLESTCERIPTGSLQKNSDNCEIWQKLFSLLGSWYNKQIKKPMTGILIGNQKVYSSNLGIFHLSFVQNF